MTPNDALHRRAAPCPNPRVLIADSEAPSRAGLRAILEASGMVVSGEAGDATTALGAALSDVPDLTIVAEDLRGGGMALTAEIARRLPSVRIVMLAGEPDDESMLQAVRIGASGYLPKSTSLERLPRAIRGVLAGEAARPRAFVGRLVQEYCDRAHRRLTVPGRPDARLTAREWDVLELMREGLDTTGMAGRLGINAVTVRRHRASILRKLGVRERRAAVRLLDAGPAPEEPEAHVATG